MSRFGANSTEAFPVICGALALGLFLVFVLMIIEQRLLGSQAVTLVLGSAYGIAAVVSGLVRGPFGTGTDEKLYHAQALSVWWGLTGDGSNADLAVLDAGKQGWPRLLGYAYATFTPWPYVGFILNAGATVLAAVVTAASARALWGEYSRSRLLAAFLLFPPFLIFTPSLLREPACWAGVACAAYGGLLLAKARWKASVGWVAIGMLILASVRTPLAVLMAMALMGALIWTAARRFGGRPMIPVLVLGGALAAVPVQLYGLSLVGLSAEQLQVNRAYLADTASSGFSGLDSQASAVSVVSALTQALPRVALGPFPGEGELSFVWAWIVLNSLFWWSLLAVLLVRALKRKQLNAFLLICAGVVLLGLGLALTNYGIVVRLRALAVVLLLPLVIQHPMRDVEREAVSAEAERVPR